MPEERRPLKEGMEKKGGVNKPPQVSKPPIKPPRQTPKNDRD